MRKVDTEEGYGGDMDLSQPHDTPGALHDHQPFMQVCLYPVEIVQEVLFREARGKFPFTVVFYLFGIQTTPGIANRPTLQVMQPESNAFIKES
jgi:hypothetical protein